MTEESKLVIAVVYGKDKGRFDVTTDDTILNLKIQIEAKFGIPVGQQRLMFGPPVVQKLRKDPEPNEKLGNLLEGFKGDLSKVELNALLLGKQPNDSVVDSKIASEYARLVSTTVEHSGNWYRCNYGDGYLLQKAFVCRTCVEDGRADPDHSMCLACADLCHMEHDVEEWGVRYNMRCDCCTQKCWKPSKGSTNPSKHVSETKMLSNEEVTKRSSRKKRSRSSSPSTPKSPFRAVPENPSSLPADSITLEPPTVTERLRCAFIVDQSTGNPPVNVILPANRHNRYPRNSLHWCYCEVDLPEEDPECGGITCILCTSCFWASHLKQMHTEQLRYIPCYGEVITGESLAFYCQTCETYVCPPCRFRCHKEHTVNNEPVYACREDGTDNNAPVGVEFNCGCGVQCLAPDTVTDDAAKEWTTPSDTVAEELMNGDIFTGFICSYCMQEYPWLYQNHPKHCYNGLLPPACTDVRKVVPCSSLRREDSKDVFPYHGMLTSVSAFKEGETCNCEKCREAFQKFAPRADREAENMILQLHDSCDRCRSSLKDETGYLCQTCELATSQSFLLCAECNATRLRLKEGSTETTAEGELPYDHDLSHEFIEDTTENLSALFSQQLIQNIDPETREYVFQNWDELKGSLTVASNLAETFGQIPLSFDEQDVKDIRSVNAKTNKDKKN